MKNRKCRFACGTVSSKETRGQIYTGIDKEKRLDATNGDYAAAK